jgi:hypothetical protein
MIGMKNWNEKNDYPESAANMKFSFVCRQKG